jgi:hypothetical protein
MPLQGLAAIVPDYIDIALRNLPRGKLPVTGVLDVRFIDLRTVDHEFPVVERNLFSLYGNHPLQEHHPASGKAHQHDIPSLWFGKEVLWPPAKIDPPIMIGRLHAVPLNAQRRADMAEKEICTDGDEGDAQKKPRGERGEKELVNPTRGNHPALTRLGIAGMAIGVRVGRD